MSPVCQTFCQPCHDQGHNDGELDETRQGILLCAEMNEQTDGLTLAADEGR